MSVHWAHYENPNIKNLLEHIESDENVLSYRKETCTLTNTNEWMNAVGDTVEVVDFVVAV